MASQAQIQANQLNAQKSTGPRSVEGKAVTRFNALQHGADAQSLILPGEDPELLARIHVEYYQQCRPNGPIETDLVESLIRASWNMRRFARIEHQLIAALVAEQEPSEYALGLAYLADARGGRALQKIFRRVQAAHNEWHKAHAELRRLQSERAPQPVAQTQPVQPVERASTPAQPAARPASPPAPAVRQPNPLPGKNWVGSEPPEWRL